MTILPPVRRPPPQIKPRWNWTEVDKVVCLTFELLKPIIQLQHTSEMISRIMRQLYLIITRSMKFVKIRIIN